MVSWSKVALSGAPIGIRLVPKKKQRGRRLPKWLLPGAVICVAGLVTAVWYLRRPLPPPRITAFTQITHDGRLKYLVGTDGNRV